MTPRIHKALSTGHETPGGIECPYCHKVLNRSSNPSGKPNFAIVPYTLTLCLQCGEIGCYKLDITKVEKADDADFQMAVSIGNVTAKHLTFLQRVSAHVKDDVAHGRTARIDHILAKIQAENN
jgi:hypothetical protein